MQEKEFDYNFESVDGLKPAAVLIPIFEKDGELHLVLTKRSQTVQHHKGQICFPGGRMDDVDQSLWHTALRETEEELGIQAAHIYYIHELPKLNTPSMFEVTPFIGFLHHHPNFAPNPHEIDSIIVVPLTHFKNQNNLRIEHREYFGKTYPVPFFNYGSYEIWGATGRIILNLLDHWA